MIIKIQNVLMVINLNSIKFDTAILVFYSLPTIVMKKNLFEFTKTNEALV